MLCSSTVGSPSPRLKCGDDWQQESHCHWRRGGGQKVCQDWVVDRVLRMHESGVSDWMSPMNTISVGRAPRPVRVWSGPSVTTICEQISEHQSIMPQKWLHTTDGRIGGYDCPIQHCLVQPRQAPGCVDPTQAIWKEEKVDFPEEELLLMELICHSKQDSKSYYNVTYAELEAHMCDAQSSMSEPKQTPPKWIRPGTNSPW